jgi:hypothetical protein
MTDTLHEYQYTFVTIYRSVLLCIRNISEKVVEEIRAHISCSKPPPPPENRAVHEIMWKNTVEPDRPEIRIWRMCIACWITKAANTQSE